MALTGKSLMDGLRNVGARLRGPAPIGPSGARRIKIENVVASQVAPGQGILISGIPGYPVQDVALTHILITYRGGGTAAQAARSVPEYETSYPEPEKFGALPSYGVFARHVRGLSLDHVELRCEAADARPAIFLADASDAELDHVRAQRAGGSSVPALVVKSASNLFIRDCAGIPDGRWTSLDSGSW